MLGSSKIFLAQGLIHTIHLNRFGLMQKNKMVHCWALHEVQLFIFQFPSAKKELSACESELILQSTSTGNSRLCSCHFKDKLKENGSSIFVWNKNAIIDFRSPEKIKRSVLYHQFMFKIFLFEHEKEEIFLSDEMNNDIDDGNCDGKADLSNTHHNNAAADSEIYFLNQKIESLELKTSLFNYFKYCLPFITANPSGLAPMRPDE
ncbi:hypothetical protein AGLY_017094 [Aphis glycines]|uniref:THAP-type domain-containing protein n=1 Tax=Aphis glycines TaxID=307491 RepID=A0A6G0SXT4_APHGL|nr:hypothetical protein AGLY_017094 [Aphis glycines]